MRIEKGVSPAVILSRRNLLTLLAKLDGHPPNSECSISAPSQYGPFMVRAEEDVEHYSHPEREAPYAGFMHPDTERVLADYRMHVTLTGNDTALD